MRKWRVGSISTGVLFILLGVILLINQVWGVELIAAILRWWPIILILLGVEVLVYHFLQKDTPLKFDFFSIFILVFALLFTLGLYTVQASGIFPAIQRAVNHNQYTIDIQKTLEIPNTVKEVVVDIPNGEIEVIGSSEKKGNVSGTARISSTSREEAEKEFSTLFTVKTVGTQAIIRLNPTPSSNWFGSIDVTAKLAISLPEGVTLKNELNNGNIDIRGMKNDISVDLMNGNIQVNEATKKLKLQTSNGEIQVNTSQIAGDWDLRSFNGEIDLVLPKNANAKLNASSDTGSVNGNLNWVEKKGNEPVGNKKEATLGAGKYEMNLENSNGSIEVNVK